jgi:hypothetical protein
MPHYEYHCPENGRTLEVYHGMSERLQTWGELCSKAECDVGATSATSPVERVISGGLAMPSSKSGSGTPASLPMAKSCGTGCGCH